MSNDTAHMAHALSLAARGLGRVWPNPAVGCVLVQSGRVVGRGWTQPGGRPHAETMALAQAGALARGGTAYVTLEPCAHHGQTPPCAEALIAAGVARVVGALRDPDPRVAGRGYAMLLAAGIAVTEAFAEHQGRLANSGFLKRIEHGLPFLTLKLASSLDGRIATASGESRWITGTAARRAVHAMRMRHDAVMVGSGTALADDPDLTVRDLGAGWQPVRVLIDSQLRHDPAGRLGHGAPVWICHARSAPAARKQAWTAQGARLIEVAEAEGHLDLRAAMIALAALGLTRVLCEGGAGLAAALLRAGLVDEVAQFTAGAVIGAEGHGALGPLGLASLAAAPRARLISQSRVGEDVLSHWRFDRHAAAR